MRAKEVVVCNKEGSKSNSAVGCIKAVGRFHMVFIGSVKALNDLFKRSELF